LEGGWRDGKLKRRLEGDRRETRETRERPEGDWRLKGDWTRKGGWRGRTEGGWMVGGWRGRQENGQTYYYRRPEARASANFHHPQ
jgi:hypothetical protein